MKTSAMPDAPLRRPVGPLPSQPNGEPPGLPIGARPLHARRRPLDSGAQAGQSSLGEGGGKFMRSFARMLALSAMLMGLAAPLVARGDTWRGFKEDTSE